MFKPNGEHVEIYHIFSPCIPSIVKNTILPTLQLGTITCSEKYLGLTTMVGRNKNQYVKSICDQAWKKLQGGMIVINST